MNNAAARNKTQITIGLDLGDRRHTYCVLDEAGKMAKEGSLGNTRAQLATGLGSGGAGAPAQVADAVREAARPVAATVSAPGDETGREVARKGHLRMLTND